MGYFHWKYGGRGFTKIFIEFIYFVFNFETNQSQGQSLAFFLFPRVSGQPLRSHAFPDADQW